MSLSLTRQRQAANSRISVVIPTYNRAELIGETLAAVFAQTLAPDEIIVVDDGSTDSTQSVLVSYGSRIHTIRIANGGDLVARNTGLLAAQGELVAFCDSDDLWMPDFLCEMSAQWQAEPGLLACYSDFRILRSDVLSHRSKYEDAAETYWTDLRMTGPYAGVFDHAIVERVLRFQPFFPSCMMVARAAFIGAGGWDEGVSRIVGCDLATMLRVAARPPLGVIRRPLVAVRKHPGNISSNTEKMNLGDARVLEHVLRTRPELTPLQTAIRDSVAERRRKALDSAFSRRDFAAVRDIYQLLPSCTPMKQRTKWLIAGLPPPLNILAASLVSH